MELSQPVIDAIFEVVGGKDPEDAVLRKDALLFKRNVSAVCKGVESSLPPLPPGLRARLPILEKFFRQAAISQEKLAEARSLFQQETLAVGSRLRRILEDPLVQEGILLSSQSLYEALRRYLSSPETSSKSSRHFERNACRHLLRACAKTTPRGLLTGVSLADWQEDQTSSTRGEFTRRTLVSLTVVRAIAEALTLQGRLSEEVVPRPNPSLHRPEPGKLAFLEFQLGRVEDQRHQIDSNELLELFLMLAEPRQLTSKSLVARAISAFSESIPPEKIEKYYHGICKLGVLIGVLEIPFEHQDGLGFLIDWLERVPAESRPDEDIRRLKHVQAVLLEIDSPVRTIDERLSLYEEVRSVLSLILPGIGDQTVADIFVVECSPPVDTQDRPPGWVRGELTAALEFCGRLGAASNEPFRYPARSAASYLLQSGRIGRADTQEIPLSDLLVDGGSGSSGVNPGPGPSGQVVESMIRNLAEWIDSYPSHEPEGLDLRDSPIAEFVSGKCPHARAEPCVVGFRLAGDAIVLEQLDGGWADPFSRHLAILGDERFERQLQEQADLVRQRVAPDQLWADVAINTLSKTDTGIWCKWRYGTVVELYRARSERPTSEHVPLRELWARVTGEPPEARIIWKRPDGSELPIRLPYSTLVAINAPFAAFLPRLSATPALQYMPFLQRALRVRKTLPRLRWGRVILQRASWLFATSELKAIADTDAWESFRRWSEWSRQKMLPRHVFIHPLNDRPQWVDLMSPLCLDSLNRLLKGLTEPELRVVEMVPLPDRGYASQALTSLLWEKIDA